MEFVSYTCQERIAYITLQRPEKRNALNYQVVEELKRAFEEAAKDSNAKVIVLKARGDAFCAGADLAYLQELQQNSFAENLEDSNHLKQLFLQIYTLPKIVIAAVQGHAIAGGSGLATVCDFTLAVPEAKFGYTEVRIGFIPAIVMVFLIRKLGEQKAKDLLISGKLITAREAQELGMISAVVDDLEGSVDSFAQMLVQKNAGQSMALTKQMIAEIQTMPIGKALTYAAEQNAHARATDDCKKGIAAFLQKQPVQW